MYTTPVLQKYIMIHADVDNKLPPLVPAEKTLMLKRLPLLVQHAKEELHPHVDADTNHRTPSSQVPGGLTLHYVEDLFGLSRNPPERPDHSYILTTSASRTSGDSRPAQVSG